MMMADDMTSMTVTRIMMTNYDDDDESHDIDIDSCHLIRGAASILPEVRSLNLEMSSFQNKWQTIDIIVTFYGVTQSTEHCFLKLINLRNVLRTSQTLQGWPESKGQ